MESSNLRVINAAVAYIVLFNVSLCFLMKITIINRRVKAKRNPAPQADDPVFCCSQPPTLKIFYLTIDVLRFNICKISFYVKSQKQC